MKRHIREWIKKLFFVFFPSRYKRWFFKRYNHPERWKEAILEPELQLLPLLLHSSSVFFDIGANIGAYTYVAERCTKHIHAFEPIPQLYNRLKKLFPEAHIHNVALGQNRQHARFRIPIIQNERIFSRATLNTDLRQENESGSIDIDVKVDTLDDFVEENGIAAIDFIKIDVEGAELQLIRGAKRVIAQLKPVLLIEIEQRHHTEDISTIVTVVKELAYECYFLDVSDRQLKPVKRLQDVQKPENVGTDQYINNFLFIPLHTTLVETLNRQLGN